MPQNKRIIFPNNPQLTSLFAQALSHPARLHIIDLLRRGRVLRCREFKELIPLSRNTISFHLAELVKFGIIRRQVENNCVVYALHPHGWPEAQQALHQYLESGHLMD